MATVSKFNKVQKAAISKIMGISVASISKIIGVTWTAAAVSKLLKSIGSGIFLEDAGVLKAYGRNENSTLGINTDKFFESTQTAVSFSKSIVAISTTEFNTAVIDTDGMAWTWGLGARGQLGNNATSDQSTPVAVVNNKTFTKIATGYQSTIGIDNNGMAWTWGAGTSGQLGIRSTTSKSTPVAVCNNITFTQVANYNAVMLGIASNGMAWGWGINGNGQLGINSTTSKSTPVAVALNLTYSYIATDGTSTCAIDYTGKAWAWGNNAYGQLGDNSNNQRQTPVAVCQPADVTFNFIAAFKTGFVALDTTGKAWGWGINSAGVLGDNSISSRLTPVAVCNNLTFSRIFTVNDRNDRMYQTVIGETTTGSHFFWGSNAYGNYSVLSGFSKMPAYNQTTPLEDIVNTCSFSQITGFSIGRDTSYIPKSGYILDVNKKAWAWGLNSNGGVGDNTTTFTSTPVAVCVPANVTFAQIVGLEQTAIALDTTGKAWAWGSNGSGITGTNAATATNYSTPVAVCLDLTYTTIRRGHFFITTLDTTGKAWAWGYNGSGQLGNNSTANSVLTPVAVCLDKTFVVLGGARHYNTVAIDYQGKLWSWGENNTGSLGINSTSTNKCTPVAVCTTLTFSRVTTNGHAHTIAQDISNKLWSWGLNSYGQLGDGTASSRLTPVAVCIPDSVTIVKIWGGYLTSFALDTQNRLWAWGINTYGQLGNGNITVQSSPIIAVCNKTWVEIETYAKQTYGLTADGKTWAWGGYDANASIYHEQLPYRTTPTQITF
jgi:alpha-tubulin suppressor-like RCC1 family protein